MSEAQAAAEIPAEHQSPEEPVEESAEEVAEEVEASPEASAEQKLESLKKKYQLKVDGKEEDLELDLNDDESVKKYLQKAKAFDQRSQELAMLKKQVDEFVTALKTDPTQVLSHMGFNMEEYVDKYIQEKLAEAEKSPEQVAQEKMQAELKAIKEEKERLLKEKEEAQLQQLRDQYAAEIERDIDSALANSGTVLPRKNPMVVRRIAETMALAIQNGYPEITAKDVIPLVEEQWKNDLRSMFDVFPEEVIENVVGKNNLDRYRKKKIGIKKTQTSTPQQMTETGVQTERKNEPTKKIKMNEFFDFRD